MSPQAEALEWLTYKVNWAFGGFNGSPNLDVIAPESFVAPSINVEGQNGGRERRGGTALVGSTIAGTPQILKFFQFKLSTSTTPIVMSAGSDGKIWKDYTTELVNSLSTTGPYDFAQYRDVVYIAVNGFAPRTYDGTTFAALGNLAGDWTGSNFPCKFLKHGRGASERLWAWRAPSNLDSLYYTANGSVNFSTGGKLRIETGDGFGLVAVAEYGRQLIAVGKRKSFVILDEDTSAANWGYEPAQFEGGCANPELLIRTPNDLVSMASDGDIYSVIAAQEYGDYRSASLSRPSYIHQWIKDNVNLLRLDQAHAVYDPTSRRIYFFLVLAGESTVRHALTYNIDREPTDAWSHFNNINYASGYNACSSSVFYDTVGRSTPHTGDYSGKTWKLNQDVKSDNSNAYDFKIRTPQISLDNPRETKLFRKVRITANPRGNYSLTMEWWVDGVSQGTVTLSSNAMGGVYGGGVYGSDSYGGQEIAEYYAELGQVGKRIQFEFRNSGAGEDFFLSELLIDFEPLGPRY